MAEECLVGLSLVLEGALARFPWDREIETALQQIRVDRD